MGALFLCLNFIAHSMIFYILSYLLLVLVSYRGSLNPYPLGLVDAISVSLVALSFVILSRKFGTKSQLAFHSLCWCILFFIICSSWFYFDYFQSLYTFEILTLQDDLKDGGKALSFEPYGWTILALIISGIVFSYFAYQKSKSSKPQRNSTFLGLFFLFLGSFGLYIVDSSITQYQKRNIPILHPANLSPIHALWYTENQQTINSDRQQAFLNFKKLNKDTPASQELQINHFDLADKPNVLIVMLESFRADLTKTYSEIAPNITPNFDQIAQQSLVARNHYSNTSFTVSAELAVWCGIFDGAGAKSFSYNLSSKSKFNCLTHKLSKVGYDNLYFHGNNSKFYNRQQLMPLMGFNRLYFHKDQPDAKSVGTQVGWGIDDKSMLDIMLKKLESRPEGKPFFAHITTLSNHYPFHWKFPLDSSQLPFPQTKQDDIWKNYLNAVFYTDYALGEFWNKFKNSKLYGNTLLIITSDHGIWRFPQKEFTTLEKNERFFRAPLLIHHPKLEKNKAISEITSHIDIGPTILDILGVSDMVNHKSLGKSILQKNAQKNSWAIMSKSLDSIFRINNTICYYNLDSCTRAQQECNGWQGEFVFNLGKNTEFIRCDSFSGDILNQYLIVENNNKIRDKELFRKSKLAIKY